MDFRTRRNWAWIPLAITCASLALAQSKGLGGMTDLEQRQYLKSILDAGLPESEIDQLGLLALNRSDLVVPEIVRRLEQDLQHPVLADRTVKLMAGMVAYSANSLAIDGIARLCALDRGRYQFLLARALYSATEGKNPYDLAYYAVANYPILGEATFDWVEDSVRYPNNASKWAQSLTRRYNGSPSSEELSADLLVAKKKGGLPAAVIEELKKVR